LISKSVIQDNILIISPNNPIRDNLLILISHGSSGLGTTEFNIAEFFLKRGFKVGLLDYFSKFNIDKLWWSDLEPYVDKIENSFYEILTNINFPNYEIVHLGFSLGGFLGILNSHMFIKNYCFYPGIIAFTNEIINKDYNNTTVFIPKFDNWCDYSYFEKHCKIPPQKIIIEKAYHSFMSKNKDIEIYVNKYITPITPISENEFMMLKPKHYWLNEKYNFNIEKIRLKYDHFSCILCLNHILKDLNEYYNFNS